MDYTLTVDESVTSLGITATGFVSSCRITIDGDAVSSGALHAIEVSSDKSVVIVVENSKSKIRHDYTIKVVHSKATPVAADPSGFPWNGNVSYGTLKDSRDGQSYRTVTIGNQTWMAQNLNHDTLNGKGSWCYNRQDGNCQTNGRLYTWAAAMGLASTYNSVTWSGSDVLRQGVCPSGWHLPNDAEWQELVDFVGGPVHAASSLKSSAGWGGGAGNGDDRYGFRLIPSGGRDKGGYFFEFDDYVHVWSSTQESDSVSLYRGVIRYDFTSVNQYSYSKESGFSVRCLRN